MESIPEGLDFPNASMGNPSTGQTWLGLLTRAHSSLDIASFYWTLTNNDTHTQEPSAQQVPGNLGPWLAAGGAMEDIGGGGGVMGFPFSPGDRWACLIQQIGHRYLEATVFTWLFGPGVFVTVMWRPLNVGVGLVTRN